MSASAKPHESDSDAYKAALCERVKTLREQTGWAPKDMATVLGVPEATYRKYENRSLLPHHLLERFAIVANVSVEYLVTGNESRRARPPEEAAARLRGSA